MRKALYIAAALCLGTALIHLWELPGHLRGWWGQGAFLLGAGALQGLYGVALLRWPARLMIVAGVAVNLVVLALHALTQLVEAYKGLHGAGMGLLSILFTTAALALLSGTLMGAHQTLRAAQLLALAPALVHLAQVADRLDEWWGFGVFFLMAGAGQLLYWLGLTAFGRNTWFLVLGISGNLSLVTLWLATHTVGVPYLRTTGIESTELRAGMVERVGVGGLAATLAEVALISLLGLMLARRYRLGTLTSPGGRRAHDRGSYAERRHVRRVERAPHDAS